MTPLEPAPTPARPATSRPARWRLSALTGAALILVGGAAITMAASPAPSTTPDQDSSTTPDTERQRPFRDGFGAFDGFAGFAGRHGGFGAGSISITAISGSSLSLETADGWTRTITVTDDTELTKDGEAIALGDLEVGDRIHFRQTVDDEGTYSISALAVVVPSVVGQVTAVDGDSITLSQPDGTSVTVNVDDSTEFTVGRETGKGLSDVEVGMILAASGEQNDDGSLDATRVRAGTIWQGMGRGGHGRGPDRWLNPDEAEPSASPDDSSTSAG